MRPRQTKAPTHSVLCLPFALSFYWHPSSPVKSQNARCQDGDHFTEALFGGRRAVSSQLRVGGGLLLERNVSRVTVNSRDDCGAKSAVLYC